MVTRINLLPPEVLEKRRAERVTIYIVVVVILVILVLAGVFSLNFWRISQAERDLEAVKVRNEKINQAIAEYKVYEKRKKELEEKEKIINEAMKGEIAWHKILNEVSMVIPSDVCLTSFAGDAETGITCKGYTLDYSFDAPDLGHKPVAKWMIRLGDIKTLTQIWLTLSQKTTLEDNPIIEFENAISIAGVKKAAPAEKPPPPPSSKSPGG